METKHLVWIGVTVGGLIGGGVGAMLDHGNPFGVWGLTLSTLGGFAGIWAGFKLGNL